MSQLFLSKHTKLIFEFLSEYPDSTARETPEGFTSTRPMSFLQRGSAHSDCSRLAAVQAADHCLRAMQMILQNTMIGRDRYLAFDRTSHQYNRDSHDHETGNALA